MRLPMVGGGGGEKKHRMPVIPGVGIAGLENMTKPKHGTQVVNDGVLVCCSGSGLSLCWCKNLTGKGCLCNVAFLCW